MPRPALSALAVFGGFLALASAFFLPVLLKGGLLAPADGVNQFVPWYRATDRIWDPWVFAGTPAFPDPQRMTWYPPAMLLSRISGSWNLFVLLGYALGGFFMHRYALAWTRSEPAAWLAGAAFAFGTFTTVHVRHPNIVHAAAWCPAILLGLERLRARPSARSMALTAGAIALAILAGYPALVVYMAPLIAAHAIVRRPAGSAWPWLARVAGCAALGAGLAAVLVLPMLEFVPHTVRGGLPERDFFGRALDPREIPRLLFPLLYGERAGADTRDPAWATIGYVGLAPLALAFLAVFARFRSDVRVRLFAVVGAVAFLLALGDATPLGRLAYHVPVLNLFRAPGRHLFVAGWCASVLAAVGLAALPRRRIDGALAAGAAAFVAALGIAWAIHPERAVLGAGFLGTPAVGVSALHAALGLGGLALAAARPATGGVAVVLAAALDLGTFASFDRWRASPPTAATFAPPPPAATYGSALRETGQRLVPVHGPAGGPATLPPNRSALWRVPSAGGYNPLRLARTVDLLDPGPRGRQLRDRALDPPRGLDLLAVRFLSVKESDRDAVRRLEDSEAWARVEAVDGAVFFERTDPMPRAWLVANARSMDDAGALATIRSGRLPEGAPFDPRAVALTDRDPGPLGPPDPAGAATVVREEATRIDVRTSSATPAFLVLSNVWYPGWHAARDDVRVPLYRADHALLGVTVPAGEHTVSFRFRPASLRVGGAASFAVLIGLLLASVRRSGP